MMNRANTAQKGYREEMDESYEASFGGKRTSNNRPKNYHLTTDEQRRKLLDAVSNRHISILRVDSQLNKEQAATELGLKYSTAKTIWKIYVCEGRESRKHQRQVAVTTGPYPTSAAAPKQQETCLLKLLPPLEPLAVAIATPSTYEGLGPNFWAEQLSKLNTPEP